MRDSQIYAVIIPLLRSELMSFVSDNGYDMPFPSVDQSYQPTQQGTPSGPSVYIHKISNHRYGYPKRTNQPNGTNIIHTEEEIIEATFQVSALFIQDPYNIDNPTASDLCNACATILQSDDSLKVMQDAGIGMERITDIRNIYFTDDSDKQESNPSFDFTVAYKSTTIKSKPSIQQTVDSGIFPI